MRTSIFSVLIFLLFILGSCKKDSPVRVIDGRWEVISLQVIEYGNTEELIEKGTTMSMMFYKCKLRANRKSEAALMIDKEGSSGLVRYDFKVQENEHYLDLLDDDNTAIGYWRIDTFESDILKVTEKFNSSETIYVWELKKEY